VSLANPALVLSTVVGALRAAVSSSLQQADEEDAPATLPTAERQCQPLKISKVTAEFTAPEGIVDVTRRLHSLPQ
jgi:hypothetical protein